LIFASRDPAMRNALLPLLRQIVGDKL